MVQCQICLQNEAKYKCPACSTQTCSLACSKLHKQKLNCTGQIDSTKYLQKTEIAGNATVLNRDYNFLSRIDRRFHVAVNDIDDKLPSLKKRRKRGFIVRNGVKVHLVPDGMQRSRLNKGRGTVWSIEFILYKNAVQDSTVVIHNIPEEKLLADTIKSRLNKQIKSLEGIEVFLAKVHTPANKPTLFKLDLNKSLIDNLQEKEVIELPTIHISSEGLPVDYTVHKSGSESGSDTDDSSSDTSSSSSSSSSRSSGSSSSGSDSDSSDGSDNSNSDESSGDEAPEESTSRPVDPKTDKVSSQDLGSLPPNPLAASISTSKPAIDSEDQRGG